MFDGAALFEVERNALEIDSGGIPFNLVNHSLRRATMTNITAALESLRSRKPREENHVNREGARSYHRSLKEQVLAVLTTGTLSDTYYASREIIATEARDVLTEMRNVDSAFLARALIYARSEGLMKTLPVFGLVILSAGGGRSKEYFEKAFRHVVRTPDDLRSFVEICKSGVIPGRSGLGGMTVKPVREWLCGMSEYHVVKYGSAASKDVTLRDILRMSHPRPGTPECAERFGWLIRGRDGLGDNTGFNPQIRALETLKRSTDESDVIALIREGRLPYEVVVPSLKATTPAIWAELLRQAPYMNLLRNLVTFTRHGVFADEANVCAAVEKLTTPKAVEHSKVLPFRFFEAWKAYVGTEGFDARIADALRAALELSFANMPSFGNRTVAIAPDTSGSMSGMISQKGKTRYIDIAGIMSGALLKRVKERAILLPFDTCVHPADKISKRDDVLVIAEKLASYGGGGTAVGSPIAHLLRHKTKVDVFIGITDNVDWAYGSGYSCFGSFLDLWHRYRKEVSPDARAFLVTIAPYRDAVSPAGEKGVHYTYGWSDKVLQYISLKLNTGENQVERIERMDLGNLSD